jgi:NADH:ubiquinone oxidoreductase subunit 6 (subunit J)
LIKTILLIIFLLIIANIAVSVIFSLLGFAVVFAFKLAVIVVFFFGIVAVYKKITGKNIKFLDRR